MSLRFAKGVRDDDLLLLQATFPDRPEQLRLALQRVLDALRRNPHLGKALDHRLSGYRSYKCHSALLPPRGSKPDLRLVYRIEADAIVIVAIRLRPDVYRIASARAGAEQAE